MTLASPTEILDRVLPPWYDSLKDIEGAQLETMHRILGIHSKTTFGVDHNLEDVEDLRSFRNEVPIRSFDDFETYLRAISRGEYRALLQEPPVCWAMTRGTTGSPKMIPVTSTTSNEVMVCGARSFLNYVYRTEDFTPLMGKTLNLFFPSQVGAVERDPRMIPYGFSSGIFARYAMQFVKGEGAADDDDGFGFVPSPEAVDAAATGLSREDWNRRFRVAYESAREADVRILGGVVPVMHAFATYLRRHHGVYPKDLWPNLRLLICSSVPKIQTRHARRLTALYGDASVVEVYGATEGVFAQQIDEEPFVTPNFDMYLFEVRAGRKVKMLHEMREGQLGSLIVSSSLFPRYEIGDVVECHGEHYYRIIGRRKWTVLTAHLAQRVAQRVIGLL